MRWAVRSDTTPMEHMKPFVDGIATLYFHERGTFTLHEWSIGCDAANDTEETLAAHLARWRPTCELDWVEIRPVVYR